MGVCIYCGSVAPPLHDEHVIPYALNGEWVLKDASCLVCAGITSGIELRLLRGEFFALRAKLGMRTRRKAERPEKLPFKFKRDGQMVEENIAVENHPASLALPLFGPPGHRDDRSDRDAIIAGRIGMLRPSKASVTDIKGATHYVVGWPEPEIFARFLGKVAYGFAVGCLGRPLIDDSYVLPAILGRTKDIGRWVGASDRPRPPADEALHAITLNVVDDEWHAHVRLFAQLAFPEYLVIVGPVPREG